MTALTKDEAKLAAKKAELRQQIKDVNARLAEARRPKTFSEQLARYSYVFIGSDGMMKLVMASSPRFRQLIVAPPLSDEAKDELIAQFREFVESIDRSYVDALASEMLARQRRRDARKAKQTT